MTRSDLGCPRWRWGDVRAASGAGQVSRPPPVRARAAGREVEKPVSDDRKYPSGRRQPLRLGHRRVTRRAAAKRRTRRVSASGRQPHPPQPWGRGHEHPDTLAAYRSGQLGGGRSGRRRSRHTVLPRLRPGHRRTVAQLRRHRRRGNPGPVTAHARQVPHRGEDGGGIRRRERRGLRQVRHPGLQCAGLRHPRGRGPRHRPDDDADQEHRLPRRVPTPRTRQRTGAPP